MPLDLNLSSSAAYLIVHPEHPDVTFTCRDLSPEEEQRLLKKYTTKKLGQRGQAQEEVDGVGFTAEKWEKTVEGWSGILEKGQPLECNAPNKRKLYDRYAATLVAFVLGELDRMVAREVGEALGN